MIGAAFLDITQRLRFVADGATGLMVPLTIAEAISHIEHLRREVATFRQFADIALVQVVDAELSARSPSASPSPPSPGTSER